jgi:hypothetical protein
MTDGKDERHHCMASTLARFEIKNWILNDLQWHNVRIKFHQTASSSSEVETNSSKKGKAIPVTGREGP